MGDVPLVSTIIPTYQRAALTVRAIRSVLSQDGADVEVVVVDDGSTDATPDLIPATFGDDPRVRYLRQDNGGVAAARNRGLDAASGEFVAFLDSDDMWLPGKLRLQLACLEAAPEAGMVWTDMTAVDADGRTIAARYLRRYYRNFHKRDLTETFERSIELPSPPPSAHGGERLWVGDIYAAMVFGNLVHTSTVLLRRDRLDQTGRFDPSFRTGEDFDFHLRTCRAGPVAFADVPTIAYRMGAPDQISGPGFGIELARSFVITVGRLADGAVDPRVPPSDVARSEAEGRAWLGEELLEAGRRAEARIELGRALSARWRLHTAGMWMLTLLPAAVTRMIRTGYGGLARRIRAGKERRSTGG